MIAKIMFLKDAYNNKLFILCYLQRFKMQQLCQRHSSYFDQTPGDFVICQTQLDPRSTWYHGVDCAVC